MFGLAREMRVLAFIALGVALFAAMPVVIYPWQAGFTIDFGVDPHRRVMSGVYPVERTADGGTYAWTAPEFSLRLPGLDRSIPWIVTLRINPGRTDQTPAQLAIAVDDGPSQFANLPVDAASERTLELPVRDRERGAVITVSVSPPFVPGPDNARRLGVPLDAVRVEPASRRVRVPSRAMPSVLVGAFAGALLGALGLPWLVSVLWLTVLAAAVATVTTLGVGPFVEPHWRAILLTTLVATMLSAMMLPVRRAGARLVVALVMSVVLVQLLVLGHPAMPFGDSVFHAHRFQDVLAGQYFFTSIAPGNYLFPYPVGLYVFARPLAPYFRTELDHVEALRLVVVASNAVGAAWLYRLVHEWCDDDGLAAATVAAYFAIPLGMLVIATGNLTNMFAQSLGTLALVSAGMLIGPPSCRRSTPGGERSPTATTTLAGPSGNSLFSRRKATVWAVVTCLLALAACLSHTSTMAVLTTQLVLAGIALACSRQRAWRHAGGMLLAAATAAALIAIGVYYSHFMDVYRQAFTRAAAETGHASAAAGGRTPGTRLMDVPRTINIVYGVPLSTLAAGGLFVLGSARYRSPIRVLLVSWLVACLTYLVIGIITPIDLRHYLAAMPAVAALVAAGAIGGWRRGGSWRGAALALVLWAAWVAAITLRAPITP